jgi:hypothetical protein
MISAEWPLPAEFLKEFPDPLASQEVEGRSTCWADGGNSIFSFSVADRFVKEFKIAEAYRRSIKQLVPAGTNILLAAARSDSNLSTSGSFGTVIRANGCDLQPALLDG